MVNYLIYIVDDEESIRDSIIMALEADFSIQAYSTAETALDAMANAPPDLMLLDVGLPGMSGIEVLRHIKDSYPDVLVIMITAFEDIDTVISAMKLGAYDYVVKPLQMDGLEITIRNALETIRLRKEVQSLHEDYLKENLPCFIAESTAIQDVMEFIQQVAKSPDTPVLIRGETGTGKELIAKAIHYRSPNFKGPFVPVNCAAIPKDLIESELFGYEKGAFSGANPSGKKGLVEAAADGTLFLDEVGDLNLEAQAKLLRFLEGGEFYKVGGVQKIRIQTRLVSATNKELDTMIAQDLFRTDLFFRLAVINVGVPSLNQRRDDVLPLAKHFLVEFSKKFGKAIEGFSQEAESMLLQHRWTGNVRELKNIVERGVLIAQETLLQPRDLGLVESQKDDGSLGSNFLPPLTDAGIDLSLVKNAVEDHYVREALRIAKGNESGAAKLLNMNHHTFRYRKKKLQIE